MQSQIYQVFSEIGKLEIGVPEKVDIQAVENPFRHRVAIFGSSFTHGYGCSGHSRLQDYFARALADADVDAFVFDAFSNPSPEITEERLFNFIEIIQAKNPGKPLIFQRTIYREWRNVNRNTDEKEMKKKEMADRMMKEACKKYKDVYYITSTNASAPSHETSADGTHPGDYGYTLWADSVRKPILKILAKYGIR